MDEQNNVWQEQPAGSGSPEREPLLAELVAQQKKQTFATRILLAVVSVLTVVILVGALTVIPKLTELSDSVQSSLTEVQTLTESAETTLGEISEVDIETLNQAIRDLSDAIAPMAEFARMFK